MIAKNRFIFNGVFRLLTSITCLVVFLTMALPVWAGQQGGPVQIQSVLYNASANSINLIAQNGTAFTGEFQTVKLAQPDRMIIDIPNTVISTPTRNLSIQQHGIDRIELSQSLGTFYQVARVTVYADSANAVDAIRVQGQGRTFSIAIGSTGDSVTLTPPLPSRKTEFSFLDQAIPENRNVITGATFESGMLKVVARNGNELRVKNQFTLSGPNRLVVDIANASLANKGMTAPMDVRSGPFRTVRLGQFDMETVRIVVETPDPDTLFITYPGEDKSQLVLSPNMTASIRTLPLENQKIGTIQDINLIKRDDTSIIRINTSDPMVRRMTRRGNQIEIELVNIAAKPTELAFDKNLFDEIKEIKFSPLNAEEPNTKVIIKLDNPRVEMESAMSTDGKVLEVFLSPTAYGRYTAKMPTVIRPDGTSELGVVPPLRKGAFTVVVDAGHGGHDKGANRAGVLEKNLNLDVAHKLKRALEAKGVTVHMTRTNDTYLKLSEITSITNRIRPDAFVSVHTNASVNTSANGIETYYYTPQSRDLANRVHRRMVNMVNSPDRGVRTAMFYVIHHTSVPAILCEMGYISNPSERDSLQSETRQRATAEAIAQGVVEFLSRRMQATAPLEE